MYSYALSELGICSIEEVEDMSWREFTLRRIGHERQQKEKWYHTRFIAYFQLTAVGAFKGSMEDFMPLDRGSAPRQLSELQIAALKAANEEFIKSQNG